MATRKRKTRKTPPFTFVKSSAAHSDGKLRPGCRRVRTPTGTRYLCPRRGR